MTANLDKTDIKTAKFFKYSGSVWKTWHDFASHIDVLSGIKIKAFKLNTVAMNELLACANCKSHFKIMRQNPQYNIDAWLKTNKDLFDLTLRMHNEANQRIGKPIYQLDDAWNMYKDSDKNCTYIEDMWKTWHYFSANVKVNDPIQILAYKLYTLTLRELIPCTNYNKIFREVVLLPVNNIAKWSRTQQDLFKFSWNVHNEVNKRLNKSDLSALEIMWQEYHEDENCDTCKIAT